MEFRLKYKKSLTFYNDIGVDIANAIATSEDLVGEFASYNYVMISVIK